MAPGIETVWLYEAEDFLGRLARWRRPGDAVFGSTARVWNHSWVANAGQHAGHLLRQLDAVAQAENWLVICGINNKGANQPLLASAFNVISVGRSNGGHPRGAAWVDSVYHSGRARPHIVAPMTTTSAATPLVSSAAALLMEVAPDADTRSALVIKAALLAGARRRFGELGRQLPGYRERAAQRAANGVDRRFGAGQLDVDFAHRIVTGSRVDGSEDPADAAAIEQFGFDYEPGFGHANRAAHYAFTAPADGHFVAALVWPVDVRLTPVDARVFVHDLNVRLVDDRERVVFASAGKADNDEHIYAAVEANRRYRLTVETAERAAGFVTPYALAWRFAADE